MSSTWYCVRIHSSIPSTAVPGRYLPGIRYVDHSIAAATAAEQQQQQPCDTTSVCEGQTVQDATQKRTARRILVSYEKKKVKIQTRIANGTCIIICKCTKARRLPRGKWTAAAAAVTRWFPQLRLTAVYWYTWYLLIYSSCIPWYSYIRQAKVGLLASLPFADDNGCG